MLHPAATYRIQANFATPLKEIARSIDYFQSLGISHLYLSPLLAAATKSAHGYDTVDFSRINPEIGTEQELKELSNNIGIILDFVPNHMCVSSKLNKWWWNVLKEGEKSRFAKYFDIEWHPPEEDLSGKVLLPFLGERIEEAKKSFTVVEEGGEKMLAYGQMRFPYHLKSAPYLLDYWKRGNYDINYRRFFNISDLASIRIEDDEVFASAHEKIFEWIKEGVVDGLRLDHIDGLYDPKQYLSRLREKWPELFLLVEKILMDDEEIPSSWSVQGSTGYDYLNLLNGSFVSCDHAREFQSLYREFTEETDSFETIVMKSKLHILNEDMRAEKKRITRAFTKHFSSYETSDVEEAVIALLVNFPVYRTYLPETGQKRLQRAIEKAKAATPKIDEKLWEELETLFLHSHSEQSLNLVKKFQQTSGPVMAKGVEDTAFYRYFPLASLNEVGGEPDRFGITRECFYEENIKRQKNAPFSLLATTTHDTKRSEDVRARLNVLSEIPHEWKTKIDQWSQWNSRHKRAELPDKNDEYLLYQTLVGTLPVASMSKSIHAGYVQRIENYMLKAIREAKRRTSWIDPNAPYERAMQAFIQAILEPSASFFQDLEQFVKRVAPFGGCNSLAQTLIKITSPGIPDFYQGTELFSLTLVDPDNREAVDFDQLSKHLAHMEEYQTLSQNPLDDKLKLYVTKKALACRQAHLQTFQNGDFVPLNASGKYENHLIAYARQDQESTLITLCGRFLAAHDLKMDWEKTALHLPGKRYKEHLSGKVFDVPDQMLNLNDVFNPLPIALLEEI